MTIIEKIKAEIKAFERKKEELIDNLRKDFPPMFQPLFEKYPTVESVCWREYTVYFNDGDELYFSVYHDEENLEINGKSIYHYEIEDEEEPKDFSDAAEEFSSILQTIPDEFYKDLFGDHKEIILKRDGTISVDSYTNHD